MGYRPSRNDGNTKIEFISISLTYDSFIQYRAKNKKIFIFNNL